MHELQKTFEQAAGAVATFEQFYPKTPFAMTVGSGGRSVPVSIKPIKTFQLAGMTFHTHRAAGNAEHSFSVTDAQSGFAVGHGATTKEAEKNFREHLIGVSQEKLHMLSSDRRADTYLDYVRIMESQGAHIPAEVVKSFHQVRQIREKQAYTQWQQGKRGGKFHKTTKGTKVYKKQ